MNSRESASLDRYITGNYGEDQFRKNPPYTYELRKRDFLESIAYDALELGHILHPWNKGKHGFHTNCRNCGAMVSCTVSNLKVREFPAHRCQILTEDSDNV